MRVAFVSFGGGALRIKDASSLGGSTNTIAPLAEMLTLRGHHVHWFGGRKESHYTDGLQRYVHPEYDLIKQIRAVFNEAPDNKTFPGDDNLSKSRYRVAWTVHRVKKLIKTGRLQIPEMDAVWINFMDVGLPNIALTLVLALVYIQRDIPVIMYDTDVRFRYRSSLGLPGNHSTKYRFSYERFLSESQAEHLRNLIILHQFKHIPQDQYFDRLETYLPIYDHRRELPIKKDPAWDLTYIGNDYMRRPWAEKWFGNPNLQARARIIGKWNTDYYEQSPMRNVPLYPPINQDLVVKRLNNSCATIHLAPPHYAALGHITTRVREATAAGCVIITPKEMTDAKLFTHPKCIIENINQVNTQIKSMRGKFGLAYRESRIMEQRKLAKVYSGMRRSYLRFIDIVEKYKDEGNPY